MTLTTRRSSRAGAAAAASVVPQAKQKRATSGFSWPQLGQLTAQAYDGGGPVWAPAAGEVQEQVPEPIRRGPPF